MGWIACPKCNRCHHRKNPQRLTRKQAIAESVQLRAEVERLKAGLDSAMAELDKDNATVEKAFMELNEKLRLSDLQISELRGIIEAMCEYYGHDTNDDGKCKPGCYSCKWAIRR